MEVWIAAAADRSRGSAPEFATILRSSTPPSFAIVKMSTTRPRRPSRAASGINAYQLTRTLLTTWFMYGPKSYPRVSDRIVGSSVEKFGNSCLPPRTPGRWPWADCRLDFSSDSATILSARFLKSGRVSDRGSVFSGRDVVSSSGSRSSGEASASSPSSAASPPSPSGSDSAPFAPISEGTTVSPRDGFGSASGRAPSAITSSGPITGGGGTGGGGVGSGVATSGSGAGGGGGGGG